MIQNAGNPGNAISVRVRGLSSISASNDPLYVVDGVPMIAGDLSQLDVGGQGVAAISSVSLDDVESVDVLKDAAATAIYGSRGSNGVVLITTKRGQTGRTTVNFNSYIGTQSASRRLPLLNAQQYLEYFNESAANDGYGDRPPRRARGGRPGQRRLAGRGAALGAGEQRRAGRERRGRAAALPPERHLVRPERHRD